MSTRIVLDNGAWIIEGTRIRPSWVATRVLAGESVRRVAKDFGLTRTQVERAVEWLKKKRAAAKKGYQTRLEREGPYLFLAPILDKLVTAGPLQQVVPGLSGQVPLPWHDRLLVALAGSGNEFIRVGRANVWAVKSESDPTDFYYVMVFGDRWVCTGPDFRFHAKDSCKHIDKVRGGEHGRRRRDGDRRLREVADGREPLGVQASG